MKTLVLIRHAEAADNTPYEDIARPLTDLGRQQAQQLGVTLEKKGLKPDLILISPAERTRQTAGLLITAFQKSPPQEKVEDSLYQASPDDILSLVHALPSTVKTVMVVGHNPTVSILANTLSTQKIAGFSPATACAFQFSEESWGAIVEYNGQFSFAVST